MSPLPNASSPPTIRDALAFVERRLAGAGIETAAAEAAWILSHVLRTDRASLFLNRDRLLDPALQDRLASLTERRAAREPLQYVLGEAEFYALTFSVGPGVLIPRPETEIVVERLLERIRPGAVVLDIGTGTGCIAITLATHGSVKRVLALDRSPEALAVARTNVDRHGLASRVHPVLGDLHRLPARSGQFDLIVSNPPYIPSGDIGGLQPEVRDWEPRLALDGGDDGSTAYRAILDQARRLLRPGGRLAFELPGTSDARPRSDVEACGWVAGIEVLEDLTERPRVLVATRGKTP